MTKTVKRHLLTKTLLAAGALIVLAAAPSAMAASDKPIKAKVKKSQNFIKLADHRSHNHSHDRVRGSRIRTNRNFNRRNGRSLRDSRFNRRNGFNNRRFGFNRGFNNSFNTPFRRSSSLFGHSGRGFSSPYRSSVGISFNLVSSDYSRYRWSQNPYSLYQPSYGAFNNYQARTTCRRVTVEGYHHGHRELVSVKQCSNPWDGTYIVQGSERIIDCRY